MGIETSSYRISTKQSSQLQLPRYMGIETLIFTIFFIIFTLQLPRYMGIETYSSQTSFSVLILQLPRYMGIETWQ